MITNRSRLLPSLLLVGALCAWAFWMLSGGLSGPIHPLQPEEGRARAVTPSLSGTIAADPPSAERAAAGADRRASLVVLRILDEQGSPIRGARVYEAKDYKASYDGAELRDLMADSAQAGVYECPCDSGASFVALVVRAPGCMASVIERAEAGGS